MYCRQTLRFVQLYIGEPQPSSELWFFRFEFNMPIFQDDLEPDRHRHPGRPSPLQREPTSSVLRRLSEESLPTELCEGPVPNDPTRPTTPRIDEEAAISCRAELIERLKRGESPTWIPNRHVSC